MTKRLHSFLCGSSPHSLLSLCVLFISISFLSFAGNYDGSKKPPRYQIVGLALHKATRQVYDADPIQFTLLADKQKATVGEEVTLTITAHYLNIPSTLLFTADGSNGFRLKVLLPDGFVQTDGNYIDYIGTALSPNNPTVVYKLTGHFEKAFDKAEFRLLRGSYYADVNSLFVEKARLSVLATPVDRLSTQKARATSANCNYSEGQYLLNNGTEAMYAHYYNGILYAAYQDGTNFRPQHWLVATGQMTAEQATCFAEDDPHNGSSTTPSNPPASACSYSEGQYLFTTSWGEVMYAHYYNGSLYAGYQDGGSFRPQHWLIATGQMTPSVASCFAENDPHTTSNPPNITQPSTPTAPSGTCGYSEGQYLLSNGTEAMYAHYYNGVLYAGYQDGSNFRPRHWLIATGKITVDQANCFAEDDPHTSTPSNPPTTTQSSNNNCGTGSGLTGFYSNTTDLSGNLAAVRTDAQINFSWSDSPIAGVVNADGFSVRWFGQVEAPVSGNYTFKTNNDDGTRLWVNGQQLIEDWNGHGPTWQQGSIYLTAGQKYEIILDYFDLWGGAQAQLYWEYPGQSLQLIPSCRLYAKGNPTSNPTASIGRSCVISTGCIDYYVDCNTGEVVDAVFYDCQTTVIGNAPHHGVGVGAVPTGGQGQPIGHGSGGVSTGNPGTNTPTITEKPVPTTAYLDGIDCDKISGWAFANSGGYANLDIYITDPNGGSSGRLIKAATIKANNNARPDVRNAYGNNPNIPLDCGFVWGIPDAYKTGQPLTVRVVPANDINPNGDVSNSPLTSSARCSNPATTNPGGTGNPTGPIILPNPLKTIQNNLLSDNMSFVKPCDVSDWKPLADYKVPQEALNRLYSIQQQYGSVLDLYDWKLQTLEKADGLVLNCDYFSVKINSLPPGFTAEQLLQYIRLHMNEFLDPQLSQFYPHPSLPNESSRWANNPVGTIFLVDIPGDDGSLVCSDYAQDHWIFSTITDAFWYDNLPVGTHPVSGNRRFGFTKNPDNSYSFYTRGVDRVTAYINDYINNNLSLIQLRKADQLWRSFQTGIINFVNARGGEAAWESEVKKRPDWETVKAVWNGQLSSDAIYCP